MRSGVLHRRFAWFVIAVLALFGLSTTLLPDAASAASGSIEVYSAKGDSSDIYTATMIADESGTPIDSALDWDSVSKADSRFAGLSDQKLVLAVSDVSATDIDGSFTIWLSGYVVGPPSLRVTCDAGPVSAADGWYLLQSPSKRPLLVWVDGSAVKIGNKMDELTLVKTNDTLTVKVGDEVGYTLTADLPTTYSLYETYVCGFDDTFDAHMTFKEDSLRVVVRDAATSTDTDITSSVTVVLSGNTLKVSCGDLKMTPAKPGDTIIATYQLICSSLVDDDTFALENTADFFYPAADGTTTHTPPDTSTVYTLHLDVLKIDDTGNPLAGARFALKDSAGNWLDLSGHFVSSDARAVFVSDDTGMISGIPAIGAGTYTLVELAAPAGYELPVVTESTIVISGIEQDGELVMTVEASGAATVESIDSTNATALASVINDKIPSTSKTSFLAKLPLTGDAIARALLVFAGLAVLTGALILIRRKRADE